LRGAGGSSQKWGSEINADPSNFFDVTHMNYSIAVLSDRPKAEEAYQLLVKESIPLEKISILGNGYTTADEYAFIDPKQPARRQALMMSYWLVPFGFIAGVAFNLSTQFDLFAWAGRTGNILLGGLFGAIGAAMGSFFMGGSGSLGDNDDSMPYKRQIKEGKYLVVVQGPSNITNKATSVLKTLNPVSVEGYVDPSRV
jgi:hypothetical protein